MIRPSEMKADACPPFPQLMSRLNGSTTRPRNIPRRMEWPLKAVYQVPLILLGCYGQSWFNSMASLAPAWAKRFRTIGAAIFWYGSTRCSFSFSIRAET